MTGILPDTAGFGRVASKQEVASQGGGGRDGWKVHWEGERGVEEEERAGAEDLPSEPVEKHNGGPACTTEFRNSVLGSFQQKTAVMFVKN